MTENCLGNVEIVFGGEWCFVKHFSVFQYSKRMRTSKIVGVTETSCHYDLGKNNRHKTEGGDGTEEKNIGEEQFRFMLGRGTTDAIFAARRVIEKHREMQKEMHLVFIDLVKAYRVPRPEVWRCLREQGVPEKYVRLMKDTYEDARTQVKTSIGVTPS